MVLMCGEGSIDAFLLGRSPIYKAIVPISMRAFQ